MINNFQIYLIFLLEQEKKFYNIIITNTIINVSNDKHIHISNDNSIGIINDDETDDEINLIENDKNKEKKLINTNNSLNGENQFNNIREKIINYIKKKFGEQHGDNIVVNSKDKILLKIFFINLVCKDLTSELC